MTIRFTTGALPLLAGAAGCLFTTAATAQTEAPATATEPSTLLTITITGERPRSLTVPTPADAARLIEQTPGAVEVVPDTAWKDGQSTTLKDVLDYAPGVFAQPKWGEDTRLSIRGSGLSRNFHLRGVTLLQNGVPFNAADGSADFQEIDPTAYRYVEVYKGSNALRYGANSLGGAINFASPTGLDRPGVEARADAGSFGFRRTAVAAGGALDRVDGYIAGSWQSQDGYRDHSYGRSIRASGNVGLRLGEDAETRFFLNVGTIDQKIPGSVTRTAALTAPKEAAAGNLRLNYQRNMDAVRLSNRTVLRFGEATSLELGAAYSDKHLIHPIYQYLDYRYRDYLGYGRLVDERTLSGHANRLTLGLALNAGTVDNRQYVNLPGGAKGALLSQSRDRATNTIVYGENAFDIVPGVSLIGGLQYLDASRKRTDRLAAPPDTSGERDYQLWSPRAGVLWQVDPGWQVFANVSRANEAPTQTELNFTNAVLADTKPQRSTTVEIGTRGNRPRLTWDLAAYHARLRNEFQYFDLGGGNVQVTNADKTIHQGLEIGGGWAFLEGLVHGGPDPDLLWLNVAYTFSDFRFDGDPVWGDNDLPGAPRHYLRAELMYRHPSGVYIGPNLEWVPQAYHVDNANSRKTTAYALLGLRAGADVADNASVYVDARNLLDRRYIASASVSATATDTSAVYEPGTGRAIVVGARLRW